MFTTHIYITNTLFAYSLYIQSSHGTASLFNMTGDCIFIYNCAKHAMRKPDGYEALASRTHINFAPQNIKYLWIWIGKVYTYIEWNGMPRYLFSWLLYPCTSYINIVAQPFSKLAYVYLHILHIYIPMCGMYVTYTHTCNFNLRCDRGVNGYLSRWDTYTFVYVHVRTRILCALKRMCFMLQVCEFNHFVLLSFKLIYILSMRHLHAYIDLSRSCFYYSNNI